MSPGTSCSFATAVTVMATPSMGNSNYSGGTSVTMSHGADDTTSQVSSVLSPPSAKGGRRKKGPSSSRRPRSSPSLSPPVSPSALAAQSVNADPAAPAAPAATRRANGVVMDKPDQQMGPTDHADNGGRVSPQACMLGSLESGPTAVGVSGPPTPHGTGGKLKRPVLEVPLSGTNLCSRTPASAPPATGAPRNSPMTGGSGEPKTKSTGNRRPPSRQRRNIAKPVATTVARNLKLGQVVAARVSKESTPASAPPPGENGVFAGKPGLLGQSLAHSVSHMPKASPAGMCSTSLYLQFGVGGAQRVQPQRLQDEPVPLSNGDIIDGILSGEFRGGDAAEKHGSCLSDPSAPALSAAFARSAHTGLDVSSGAGGNVSSAPAVDRKDMLVTSDRKTPASNGRDSKPVRRRSIGKAPRAKRPPRQSKGQAGIARLTPSVGAKKEEKMRSVGMTAVNDTPKPHLVGQPLRPGFVTPGQAGNVAKLPGQVANPKVVPQPSISHQFLQQEQPAVPVCRQPGQQVAGNNPVATGQVQPSEIQGVRAGSAHGQPVRGAHGRQPQGRAPSVAKRSAQIAKNQAGSGNASGGPATAVGVAAQSKGRILGPHGAEDCQQQPQQQPKPHQPRQQPKAQPSQAQQGRRQARGRAPAKSRQVSKGLNLAVAGNPAGQGLRQGLVATVVEGTAESSANCKNQSSQAVPSKVMETPQAEQGDSAPPLAVRGKVVAQGRGRGRGRGPMKAPSLQQCDTANMTGSAGVPGVSGETAKVGPSTMAQVGVNGNGNLQKKGQPRGDTASAKEVEQQTAETKARKQEENRARARARRAKTKQAKQEAHARQTEAVTAKKQGSVGRVQAADAALGVGGQGPGFGSNVNGNGADMSLQGLAEPDVMMDGDVHSQLLNALNGDEDSFAAVNSMDGGMNHSGGRRVVGMHVDGPPKEMVWDGLDVGAGMMVNADIAPGEMDIRGLARSDGGAIEFAMDVDGDLFAPPM